VAVALLGGPVARSSSYGAALNTPAWYRPITDHRIQRKNFRLDKHGKPVCDAHRLDISAQRRQREVATPAESAVVVAKVAAPAKSIG
jgi:hypothetical protein